MRPPLTAATPAPRGTLSLQVQRLTKYPLLLRELLERLPDQHPHRAKLTAAAVEIAQTN